MYCTILRSYYNECGHTTDEKHTIPCTYVPCTTLTLPKICEEETELCEDYEDGISTPHPLERRVQIRAEFILEKAAYDQQWEEIEREEREFCNSITAENVTLAQAQQLDFLWNQVEFDHWYGWRDEAENRRTGLQNAILKIPFRLFLELSEDAMLTHVETANWCLHNTLDHLL